jgi:hypothetical protein
VRLSVGTVLVAPCTVAWLLFKSERELEEEYLVTKTVAEQMLNKNMYSYQAGVSCHYHYQNDLAYCSQVPHILSGFRIRARVMRIYIYIQMRIRIKAPLKQVQISFNKKL